MNFDMNYRSFKLNLKDIFAQKFGCAYIFML